MVCKLCNSNPVITLISGKKLCEKDFIKYFEKKVFRAIGKYSLVQEKDRICVGISGGKDSLSILYVLNKLNSRIKNFELFALLIDEGIINYRSKTISDAKRFCKEYNIRLHIYSFKKEFGKSLDELTKSSNLVPCSICGVFRRYLLNKKARDLKATKLATGHNLDDEAQAVLMNQFRNNLKLNARMGPITGILKDKRFIPRIKPLYFMTEKEVMIYAYLKGFTSEFIECPNAGLSYRGKIRDMLNDFENKHPGTKYSIINSYLEILPLLKEKYRHSKTKINECMKCGESCSGAICNACILIDRLIKKPVSRKIKFKPHK